MELELFKFEKERYSRFDKDLMAIETACFHPNIQETTHCKKKLLTLEDAIVFLARDNKIVGESYALPLNRYKKYPDAQKLIYYYEQRNMKALYHVSLAVLPEYRNKGIGRKLLHSLLNEGRQRGYDVLVAHARIGASLALHVAFGAKVMGSYPNWFKTGDTYCLCEIPLKNSRLGDMRPKG